MEILIDTLIGAVGHEAVVAVLSVETVVGGVVVAVFSFLVRVVRAILDIQMRNVNTLPAETQMYDTSMSL